MHSWLKAVLRVASAAVIGLGLAWYFDQPDPEARARTRQAKPRPRPLTFQAAAEANDTASTPGPTPTNGPQPRRPADAGTLLGSTDDPHANEPLQHPAASGHPALQHHDHEDHVPSERLQALLGNPDKVQVGKLHRLKLEREAPLWTTRYELRTAGGGTVEVQLPGGSDGTVAQQVGHVPAPDDGAEIALTWDERGRPVWSYHRDGELTGGSLENHVIHWR